MTQQNRVLVTGATGFVGAAVTKQLLKAGFAVNGLCRQGADTRNIDRLEVDIVTGDLTDKNSLARALTGCRYLFHVAADYRLYVPDPDTMHAINVTGTRDLMLAALDAGIERVIYTSTVAAIGLHTDGTPADETTPVNTSDLIGPYKQTKYEAQCEVQRLIKEHRLPAVIVHPSTPVGPGDIKPTPTGRLILEAARGKVPAFVDTGLNVVHVDDVAYGHLLALRHGQIGRHYILGGENMTLQTLLQILAHQCGRRPPRIKLPPDLVLPLAYIGEWWTRLAGTADPLMTVTGVKLAKKPMFFSSERAIDELGYQPRPAEDALQDALYWFQQHMANY